MSSRKIERLRSVPLFAGLQDATLEKVARCAKEFDAPAGQVLIQPNTAGSGLFVIEEGEAVVESPGRKLDRGPGDFIGELAVITDRVRSARVRCVTDVKGWAISRFDFQELITSEPELALRLLEELASRLADTNI